MLFSIFSPAGGCLLAMTCDYRAMLGPKFTIGLNETQLGIVAPYWFKDTMVNTIGTRQTELALMMGTLFTSEQAFYRGELPRCLPLEDNPSGQYTLKDDYGIAMRSTVETEEDLQAVLARIPHAQNFKFLIIE